METCACCFVPEVYKEKVSQRGLFDSMVALESDAQNMFISRGGPCRPLNRECSKTSDCCTGYCSVLDRKEGFCYDPLLSKSEHTNVMPRSRGAQHVIEDSHNYSSSNTVATVKDEKSSLGGGGEGGPPKNNQGNT